MMNENTDFKSLRPLYAVIFLGFFGYALTIALFIPLLMEQHIALLAVNASTATRTSVAGFLLAMYPLGQFIGSPIVGQLSDHYGRKRVLLISLCLCLFGFFMMGLAIVLQQIALLFISCFFTGLCESNMAIAQSVIADRCQHNPNQKTTLIGYAYAAASLGFTLGPLLAAKSVTTLGFSAPFFITAFGILFIIAWLRFSFTDNKLLTATKPIQLGQAFYAIKTLISHRHLRRIYAINFFIFFAVQGLYRVMPMYIVDTWHPSVVTYTLIIAYVSALCLIANLFITGRLAKCISTKNLLILLCALGGVAVLVMVIPQAFSSIWLTYGFAVMPTVMALAVSTTWLSNHAGNHEQGQVLGNNQALLVLGEASSAAIGGVIAAIAIPLPVIIMGIILILTALFIWRTP